jgi:glycosyltransferase involved in cell wall biosynthesis
MGLDNKITVVTVSFNNAALIEKTIKNVFEVAPPGSDYIIIDGKSTDGTAEIIKKYSSKLKYWVSEPDGGIYDAMNKGWEKADKDSYILYLGCGDLLLALPEAASFAKADIVAGSVQIGDKFTYQPKTDIRLKLGNTLHHQALLIKKKLHQAPPFNTAYKTYADFDFNQRLLKAGHKIYTDPEFKAFATEGGASTKFDRQQSLAIVNKNFGLFYKGLATLYYYLRHEV